MGGGGTVLRAQWGPEHERPRLCVFGHVATADIKRFLDQQHGHEQNHSWKNVIKQEIE